MAGRLVRLFNPALSRSFSLGQCSACRQRCMVLIEGGRSIFLQIKDSSQVDM
jgi:hypothetical protein